jgi:hypothetical protein
VHLGKFQMVRRTLFFMCFLQHLGMDNIENKFSIVAMVSIVAETCLQNRCFEKGFITPISIVACVYVAGLT